MKRIAIVVAAAALLPGCGLPVGVQLASLAIQGMSLAATGKTPTDHGLSLIAEKDCATWRPLTGEPICSDLPAEEPAIVVAEATEPDVEAGPPAPSTWALPEATRPADTVPAKPAAASLYLVVGSFEAPEHARRLAGRHAALELLVMPAEVRGETVYRVVAGPVARSAEAAERRRLAAVGLADAWSLPLGAVRTAAAHPLSSS